MELQDGVAKLKRKHNYYYQCQVVMAITETTMIDFVVYMKDSIFVETINFDAVMWNTIMLPELSKLYFDFLADKIFEYNK